MNVGDGGFPANGSSETRRPMADRDRGQPHSGGSARPAHVERLVWLAAEICGVSPLAALVLQSKPGPLARNMVAAWLHDDEGWTWRRIAETLGREDSTIRINYGNFKRKLKGPNGLDELYAIFRRRAVNL